MLPLGTHCHTHYHLLLFKVKDLVAKQHPTNMYVCMYVCMYACMYATKKKFKMGEDDSDVVVGC